MNVMNLVNTVADVLDLINKWQPLEITQMLGVMKETHKLVKVEAKAKDVEGSQEPEEEEEQEAKMLMTELIKSQPWRMKPKKEPPFM